jgi:hypothetical protein
MHCFEGHHVTTLGEITSKEGSRHEIQELDSINRLVQVDYLFLTINSLIEIDYLFLTILRLVEIDYQFLTIIRLNEND